MNEIPLRFAQVAKSLGGRTILDGIDFTCPPGVITALLGPNGAGKTTAVTIAAGLRRPSAGSATIFGLPAHSRAARLRSAIVPQEVGFPATVRVSELFAFVRAQRAPSSLAPPPDELISRLGLDALWSQLVGGLSGGQRRRLVLALAMLDAPELLILDEATTNLDEESRAAAWQLVREYADRGGAVLATSHILTEIEDNAHAVVVIAGGVTRRCGSLADIRAVVSRREVRLTIAPHLLATAGSLISAQSLGTVRDATEVGELRVYTSVPERLVTCLLELDSSASGLTVAEPGLADALAALLSADEPAQGSGAEGHRCGEVLA